MLSAARVARASHIDAPAPASNAPRPRPERTNESVHSGIQDSGVAPSHLVDVELLCVRYLWDDAEYLWLGQRSLDEDRFLSCNLNINWPNQTAAERAETIADQSSILSALHDIFDRMIITTRVLSSRSREDENRFAGWLSYPNFDLAWKSVNALHEFLRGRGLGMKQWSRDLFIPRGWR